ncbi:MAG TPA: ATP-binding protein, partial [Acetobacteraceae bacterium]
MNGVATAQDQSRGFLRSAAVRFGIIYASLFGISAIALAAFLWWSTAGFMQRQTDSSIAADLAALNERYGDDGLPGLIDMIEQRIASNIDDDAFYLLADSSLHKVAGNLDAWPARLTLDTDQARMPIDRAGLRSMTQLQRYFLPNGYVLLIGRDVEARTRLSRLMESAMLWAAAIAFVLGSIGAWAVRGLFSATLADLSRIAAAVSAGDLTRRVQVTGQDEEFDMLAEAINDMLDRIARLMDGVRQVSNAIAHDLRTPITRARTRLEDAAIHAQCEADLRAAIERAQSDLDGIVAVFQSLLRISEIEAGARRSAFAPVDLAALLRDLAETYEVVAEAEGKSLRADIPESLPGFGDRGMVQQAVANLLDNALKFSPSGSEILLVAAAVAHAAEITVADRGPGIPEADRPR